MSIAVRWAERPEGIVGKAYSQAMDIIHAWRERPDNEQAGAEVNWWPAVDLAERIAGAILDASGYDPALLEVAVDGGTCDDPMRKWSMGDVDAEMERTRWKWAEAAERDEGARGGGR
jgi:hypothetical protein